MELRVSHKTHGPPRTERPAWASAGQRQGAARHALSPKAELCWAANPSRHFGGEGRGEGEGSPKQRRPPLPSPLPPWRKAGRRLAALDRGGEGVAIPRPATIPKSMTAGRA